jgi:hypothetical protein
VKSCGICGEQGGTGAGSLRVLRFPLPLIVPQSSSSVIQCWFSRPTDGLNNGGLGYTQMGGGGGGKIEEFLF